MAICRQKRGDKVYLYRYKSVREGKRVRHVFQEYLGIEGPDGKPVKKPRRVLDKVKLSHARDYGAVAVLWRLCQELGIEETVDTIVAKKKGFSAGRLLSLMAINRCLEPKSLNSFSYWYSRTELPRLADLAPRYLSKNNLLAAMDAVCGEDEEWGEYDYTLSIEKAIFEGLKEGGILPEDALQSILYDITATLFHGGRCIIAELGHNHEKIKRKQVNIALVVTRKYGIPIFHMVFRGSINSARTVGKVLDAMKEFGIEKATLIWDRGMTSEETIRWAKDQGLELIGGLKRDILEVERLFQEEDIPEDPQCLVKKYEEHGVYAVGKEMDLLGARRKVVIYLNTRRRDDVRLNRNEKIKAALGKLEKLSHQVYEGKKWRGWGMEEKEKAARAEVKKILRGVKDYIKVHYSQEDGGLKVDYKLDKEALGKASRRDGKYALVSTDLSLDAEDMVTAYFQKTVIERAFRILNQVVKLEPVRHRKACRVRAYSFACYLAYLFLTILDYRLKTAGISESVEHVLERLNAVEWITVSYGKQKESRCLNLGTYEGKVLTKLKMRDICPIKTIDRRPAQM